SKVFRFAYPDPLYARLAVEALAGWRAIEEETATSLLTPSGLLMIGKAASKIESDTARTLAALGLEAEMLSSAAAAARFPQFNPNAFDHAVFDPSGAVANAEAALRSLIALARKRNVQIIEDSRVAGVAPSAGGRIVVSIDGAESIDCRRALIAAG